MEKIKHIFFDLDATLWDFEKNSQEALFEMFHHDEMNIKCGVDFETFHLEYKLINAELWRLYGLHEVTKEELRYQRFHKTFQFFNFKNLDLAKHWADKYVFISPRKTNLINGTIDILEYLKPNYDLHIITNGFKEAQEIKFECCNLKPYFFEILISEELGVHKPHKRIFEIAQNLVNATHDECVMIGDSFESDVEGALNANWQAIYFNNFRALDASRSHVKTINELSELKTFF
jgi:putative hydrolase of the HAD superfamily